MKIFLAGDSLVKDYKEEEFIGGWGQYLRQLCDLEVVNYAEGGRSSRLFINEGRLNVIDKEINRGDYLFIEFCHNDDDSKEYKTMFNRLTPLGRPDAHGRYPLIPGEQTDKRYLPPEYLAKLYKDDKISDKQAVINNIYNMFDAYPGDKYYPYSEDGSKGTYKWFLKQFLDAARRNGAVPVLVTPPARTFFTQEGKIADGAGLHGGDDFSYVRAMKQLAVETNTPVIDLFEMSREYFESIGREKIHFLTSIKSGVNKGIWPDDFDREIKKSETVPENTHMNKYGAYILACKIVEAVKNSNDKQLEQLNKHFALKDLGVAVPDGLQ
ncbi:MAG: GDSL-type esterase/lipase family protein [Eubacteriales bacterium]|nr:GDSL-type esterase/lipase family protein [Eubacteriales bacterium]